MRSYAELLLLAFGISLLCQAQDATQSTTETGAAIAAYRDGDYERAIPLLERSAAASPNDAPLHAALLSALTYQGHVDEASDAADDDAVKFSQSAAILAARGEYAFYMGDLPSAEKLFLDAFHLDPSCARAVFGISRIRHAQSLRRTARLQLMKAYELDPGDALIAYRWMSYLVGDKRRELLPPFMAAHPWFYKHLDEYRLTARDANQELNGQKLWQQDSPPLETDLRLFDLRPNGRMIRGIGIELKIEDRKPLTLLLDTGASGIYISQRAVDKAGLDHLGAGRSWGVGDGGVNHDFYAVASTCQIGALHFRNCWLQARSGKSVVDNDVDGLMGADVFSDYLLDLNFQKHNLHLTPLPPRDNNPQGYDREISPAEKDFTPVFLFGHHLCVSTTVNQTATGLFVLDTGASLTNIDTTFARLATKIAGNANIRVRGLSGDVKDVFRTGEAELQFARFRQQNIAMLAFNLNPSPEHLETRISGLLGFPVLYMFRLQIDYRNGLVNFNYLYEKKKKS